MKFFVKQRWFELLLVLVAIILTSVFFTSVTDDYASFGWNSAAGQFSNYPLCEYYWGALGIGFIFKILHTHFPRYNWEGGAIFVSGYICLYLLLRTIKTTILKNHASVFFVRIVQVLFSLIFIENVIFLCATRPSLMYCGIALINLLFSNNLGKKGVIINTLIFIFGMLVRPESSVGMLGLISLGYLVYSFDPAHVFRRILFPVVAILFLFFMYSLDWSDSDLFIKKIEPEVEYKLMDKRLVGISSMKTAMDTVKYEAVAAGLCFDTRTLTPEYFRSILLPGADLSFKHAANRFFHTLSLYKYYVFFPISYFALLLFCLILPSYRVVFLKIGFFQVATFVIMYSVDYTGALLAGRHFLNIEIISLLISLFYFSNAFVSSGFGTQKPTLIEGCLMSFIIGVSFILIMGSACLNVRYYKTDSEAVATSTYCYEAAMQAMDNSYTDRIIILTTNNFHLFDHTFSFENKIYRRNKYIMFDVWTYWLDPQYLRYVGDVCHCDPLDPVIFFNWLSNEHALYIAEPWRFDLTKKYMNLVHDQKLNFVVDSNYMKPQCIENTDMSAFELRTITVVQ